MKIRGLLTALDPVLASRGIISDADGFKGGEVVGPDAIRPFVVAQLAGRTNSERTVLAIVATTREAQDLTQSLRGFLPAESVVEFPSWETLPHERLSPRADTVGQRLAVLRRLRHSEESDGPIRVVVAPVRAVLQPIVAGLGDLEPVAWNVGDEINVEDVLNKLVMAGYVRSELVERRGEFAVRGGILDVFPPTLDHPLRTELWGDTVEEIRSFAVADQRSRAVAPEESLWAPVCRELVLTDEVRERAAALRETHPQLSDICTKLEAGIAVEGMEALAPVLVDSMESLFEQFSGDAVVVVCDPERVRTRAHDLLTTSEEFLKASWLIAADGGELPMEFEGSQFYTWDEARDLAGDRTWWSTSSFGFDVELQEASDVHRVDSGVELGARYRKNTDELLADLRARLDLNWAVVVLTEGHGSAERMCEVLNGADVAARLVDELDTAPEPNLVTVTTANLEAGFLAPSAKLMVVTQADISGERVATKDMQRMPSRRRGGLDALALAPGDFVVHEQHGVGRYVEMVSREVQGSMREYLVVEYAPSKRGGPADRLFVPTDQLDQVTRYSGGEAPALSRMGGADWVKTKGRARKAVKEIAAGLIRLYSARMAAPGFAFSPDTPWQRELEDAFPYNETIDQLASIDEVKADMERPVPMDRLICGDVGYGKTEIAVRAAFKAVQDGKQVAVIVPTTLLSQQHFVTFSDRYANFPVKVAGLSRFQTEREARAVIAGLADGTVDVVIGTHRLFSAEIVFKDLGLVIVDEEQRFGVEHKEHLKQMRADVDVLAMSATPIPRTLEMAVTGIREMSTIQTPPEERHPVLTYVGPYEDRQVAAAIRRELLREGQVFYLHNRVESIDAAALRLRELVPEARIAIAHGQMSEAALEQVIVDFWERAFDVLVCTTIVENGLDIANANTLIVERADRLGLSQLHQLRGRVGRGRERAYAYFLYPHDIPLTETAHDRLSTIAQHSELGGGMAVAMKDLEIRGAGNLLGGEQSGHIAGVGFDLYVRMVGEAVAEFRAGDGPAVEPPPVRIELPVDARIPQDYIAEERLRLQVYKQIAAITNDEQAASVHTELLDRYGNLPDQVDRLLHVAQLRQVAVRVGVQEIQLTGQNIRFSPVDLPDSRRLKLERLYPGTLVKPATSLIIVPAPKTSRVGGQLVRDNDVIEWTRTLLLEVLGDN
jgi:transcription-repair coupling factor (superfamily II helicase)